MFNSLSMYFKEMYPIMPRLMLGYMVSNEMYFMVLLNQGVLNPVLGMQELVLGFTVFSFLCWLSMADDFKDYELDCSLFSHSPLPSGRVYKGDLYLFAECLMVFTMLINLMFMPFKHFMFCMMLYTYGSLMAVWFFQKHKMQKSLPLALVTHNPVQMMLNMYMMSYVMMKYNLEMFTLHNAMAVFTLYFPALTWEVSRKMRAPKDETEYVTYSKLFGYKKATNFVLFVTYLDMVTNLMLVWNLNKMSMMLLLMNLAWMTMESISFKLDPTKFKMVDKMESYTYMQETMMMLTMICTLLMSSWYYGELGW